MTRRSLLLSLGTVLAPRNWAAATPEDEALRRKDKLIVHSARPLDLETPPSLLDSWMTPNRRFFVRSHFYIPHVEAGTWRLRVEGLVQKPLELTLEQLQRLPQVEAVVTLECAGNGRALFRPRVAGIQWRKGAVGTARWKGVRLADVLAMASLKPEGRHLAFDGADVPVGTAPEFIRSVPVEKCLDPATLLATHMNGEPLPLEHGYPLRLITPGWEGAACVKWLTRITAIPQEFDGFFMKTAYRFPVKPVAPDTAVDAADMQAITALAVKSIITGTRGAIRGFAWAGENEVARVEVSLDAGKTWQEAKLGPDQARYAWRGFRFGLTQVPESPLPVAVRATDSAGRTQPAGQQWNPSGYLYNVPDRVTVGQAESMPPPFQLPPGEGLKIFKARCLACHDEAVTVSQRLDPGRWTREVEKMMRWGAQLSDAEKETLVRYLSERLR